MESTKWDTLSRRNAFIDVTREDCVEFVQAMLKKCWLQMLVEGNFYQSEAKTLFESAISILGG